MYKERLLTPGPTPIPQRVLQAMDLPMLHHRSDVFKKELIKACEGTRWLLGWDSDPIFLACSGTGAMEASLLNTCAPGDTIITVNGGVFGARWGKIAERLQLQAKEIEVSWGSPVTVEQAQQAVLANPHAKAFCIQHSETSTTVLHPVAEVLRAVKAAAPKMLTIVDGISSCATTPFPGNPSTVDMYIAGSQKALMLPPGLSIMVLSQLAWESVEAGPKRSLYFDLAGERKSLKGGETSWTPASTIIVGLNAAIDMFKAEGLEPIYRRHELLSRMARRGVRALGCEVLAPDAPCPSVTGFVPPPSIDADALRSAVRSRFGIRLAGGQGKFKGKVIRIGHMGYVDPFDVTATISALGLSLTSMGAPVQAGDALAECLKELDA
jgi:aspartate aminotransferase-like enzyme